jgi:hypothetical protein
MKTLLPLLILSLLGCATARMVEERGTSEYAPSNEKAGGRVVYQLNGAGFVVRARREDAYQQMHERCGGDYRITSEQDVAAGGVGFGSATVIGNSAFGGGSSATVFMHLIDFECGGGPARRANGTAEPGPTPNSYVNAEGETVEYE